MTDISKINSEHLEDYAKQATHSRSGSDIEDTTNSDIEKRVNDVSHDRDNINDDKVTMKTWAVVVV